MKPLRTRRLIWRGVLRHVLRLWSVSIRGGGLLGPFAVTNATEGKGKGRAKKLTPEEAARLRARVRAALGSGRWRTMARFARDANIAQGTIHVFLRGGGSTRRVAERLAKACGDELDAVIDPASEWPLDFGEAPLFGAPVPVPVLNWTNREVEEGWELPTLSTRFFVAKIVEPFALLEFVPEGLTLRDVQRAESVYRQARAIRRHVSTRYFVATHGRITRRNHEDDADD